MRIGEQIFRLAKPEKRRNTLCISSFSGKVRRKRCRQDVRGDLFSVSLRNYIANVLHARDTARSYIRTIRKEISTLNEMPARYKPVNDEPWHSRGIRRIMANNFYVYYRIDEESKRVFILNVIYARRDQLRVLERMNTD